MVAPTYAQARRAWRALADDWRQLVERHLPETEAEGFWRQSRPLADGDPPQGWKLHVSATILAAPELLRRLVPLLERAGVVFKAPASLEEVKRLNCGLFYGYPQIGKCVTAYPRSEAEALALAARIDARVGDLPGPRVPSDRPYRRHSRVHVRYGAFVHLRMPAEADAEVTGEDVAEVLAMRDPDGELVPDARRPGEAVPPWLADPFPALEAEPASPLRNRVWAYEALSQRGKGGVYRALDLDATPIRTCVLKEGRRHGEVDLDGRDGADRVHQEVAALGALGAAGVPVPAVYDVFAAEGNAYAVLEAVDGDNFQELLLARRRKLPVAEALDYGLAIAELLAAVHAAGWAWRDLKPLNLIRNADGRLRPLDFEGASAFADPDPMPWGTDGYVPADWLDHAPTRRERARRHRRQDLYALGATLHQLLSHRLPEAPLPPVGRHRRGVPPAVRRLIADLVGNDGAAVPTATDAARILATRT